MSLSDFTVGETKYYDIHDNDVGYTTLGRKVPTDDYGRHCS